MATIGKNKRKQIEVNDTIHNCILSVDSQEEVDALNFCCEAVQLSVLNDFSYQPCSFDLSEPVDYVDVYGKTRCLFRDHIYSPDFCFMIDPNRNLDISKEFKIQQNDLSASQLSVYVDVKGTFAGHDGGRSFSLNQKWTWQKFGVYVYKLVPKIFFSKFGCPANSFKSKKTNKPRKMFLGMHTIAEKFGLK